MPRPASAKLKRDLYERKNEIETLRRELKDMKIDYAKLIKKIKYIQEEIIELPSYEQKIKVMKLDYKRYQERLNKLLKLEENQRKRDEEYIRRKKNELV